MPVLFSLTMGACQGHNPVAPSNRNPSILSLTVFPTSLGSGDSAIVVCNALDPDGDTLVHDWTTDARLILRDARPGDMEVYDLPSNSEIVYRSNVTPVSDTAWVRCYVRDHKGGVDSRRITVVLTDP